MPPPQRLPHTVPRHRSTRWSGVQVPRFDKQHRPAGAQSADRRPFKSEDPSRASPEELKDAFDGYFAYFGRYTVDERAGTVTHHLEGGSYPNFVGTDQRRLFMLQGDRLVLSAPPERMGGSEVTYVATWERQP
jgi:Lipocalin-like domain